MQTEITKQTHDSSGSSIAMFDSAAGIAGTKQHVQTRKSEVHTRSDPWSDHEYFIEF